MIRESLKKRYLDNKELKVKLDQKNIEIQQEKVIVEKNIKQLLEMNNETVFSISNINNAIKRKKKSFSKKEKKFSKNIMSIVLSFILVNIGLFSYEYISFEQNKSVYEEKIKELDSLRNKEMLEASLRKKNKIKDMLTSSTQKSFFLTENNENSANNYLKSLVKSSTDTLKLYNIDNENFYVYQNKDVMPMYSNVDPGTSTIYPGAIINGASLFSSAYTIVPINRTGMKLTSNIANSKPINVEEVSYSNVNSALNDFATSFKGDVLKSWSYDMQEVKNIEDINKALGIGVNIKYVDLGLKLEKSIVSEKTNLLVVIRQNYYSVDAEPKNRPVDYFEKGADLSNVGVFEPAYISQVDYGRMAVLLINSDLEASELKAGIDAGISGIKGGYDSDKKFEDSIISYTLQIFGGGNNTQISNVTGNDSDVIEKDGMFAKFRKNFFGGEEKDVTASYIKSVTEFIDNGNADGLTNAVPIGYKLKYINDNSVVPCLSVSDHNIYIADDIYMLDIQVDDFESKDDYVVTFMQNSPNTAILSQSTIVIKDGKTDGSSVKAIIDKNDVSPIVINISQKNKVISNNQFVDVSNFDTNETIKVPLTSIGKNNKDTITLNVKKTEVVGNIE